MIPLLVALQLHFGPHFGPMMEYPRFIGKTQEIEIATVRWDYRAQAWDPPQTAQRRAWLLKHSHILIDWRYNIAERIWERRPGPRRGLM